MARRGSGGPSEGLGALLAGLARQPVKANMLEHFPSGRWGYGAGTHADLGFERTDGSPITAEDLRAIQQFGLGVVRNVRKRTWATEAEAIAAADAIGAPVGSFSQEWVHPKDRPAANRRIAAAMSDAVVDEGLRPLRPDGSNVRPGDRLRCWHRNGSTDELQVRWMMGADETASGKPIVSADSLTTKGTGVDPLRNAARCLVYPRRR